MTWLKIAEGRSGAREVATALLLFWVFMVIWAQFIAPPDTFFERNFESITTAIFAVVMGAFGIHQVFNRLDQNRPPPPRPTGPKPTTID